MSQKKSYEIYVRDPNGWDQACPDAKGVFFGPNSDERYIHPVDGGDNVAGSLIVRGYRAAIARLSDLRITGDWNVADAGADVDDDRVPAYAMRGWLGDK